MASSPSFLSARGARFGHFSKGGSLQPRPPNGILLCFLLLRLSLSLFPERKKDNGFCQVVDESEEVLYLTHFCIYETVEERSRRINWRKLSSFSIFPERKKERRMALPSRRCRSRRAVVVVRERERRVKVRRFCISHTLLYLMMSKRSSSKKEADKKRIFGSCRFQFQKF